MEEQLINLVSKVNIDANEIIESMSESDVDSALYDWTQYEFSKELADNFEYNGEKQVVSYVEEGWIFADQGEWNDEAVWETRQETKYLHLYSESSIEIYFSLTFIDNEIQIGRIARVV